MQDYLALVTDAMMLLPTDQDDTIRRTCMVPGCVADLAGCSRYCQAKRMCEAHMKANSVKRAGSDQAWRFCQQCGKLELLSAFDSNKRSCRRQLAKRREAFARQANGTARSKAPSWSMSEPLAVLDLPAGAAPAADLFAQAAVPAPTTPMQAAYVPALGAGATAGCAGSNPHLEQQLRFFQEKCAMLRMQIQMLEEHQGCAGMPEDQQQWGAAASEGMLSPAGTAVCSPTPAQCAQPVMTYTPFYKTDMDAVGAAGLASCTSMGANFCGTGNSMPLPAVMASGCSTMTDISLLPPGSSSAFGTAAGMGPAFYSMQQQACTACAPASEQVLHAANMVHQPGVHSEPVNAFAFSSRGSMEPSVPSSLSWSCAQQQQMMQPPVHVAQMLGGIMSAPLPQWGTSAGLPTAICGTRSSSLPAMCAGGAAAEGLMVLKEEEDDDLGLNLMDCDSSEEMADMLEMALLEAGMQAREASTNNCPAGAPMMC